MRYLSLFCVALVFVVGCKRGSEVKTGPVKTPAQEAREAIKEWEERLESKLKKEKEVADKAELEKATVAKLKSDADKKAAEDLRAEIKKEKDAADKAKEDAEKAKEALDGPLKKLQDRLEALEKAKAAKPLLASTPHELAARAEQARIEACQKLLREIDNLNHKWWRLHHEVRVIAGIELRFGAGSLGELPREDPRYLWSPVDIKKFEVSTREIIRTDEEKAVQKEALKKGKDARKIPLGEVANRRDEIAKIERDIFFKWRQFYPWMNEPTTWRVANFWLARAR